MKDITAAERSNGAYSLHFAIEDQRYREFQELVEDTENALRMQGASVSERISEIINYQDNAGKTPLHVYAFASGQMVENLWVAKFLLSKGADINAIDNNGNTALHMCVNAYQSRSRVRDTQKKLGIKEADEFILIGTAPFLGWLLENGCNSNIRNNQGQTALEYLKSVAPNGVNLDEKTLKEAYRYYEKTGEYMELRTKDVLKYQRALESERAKNKDNQCCIMM